MSLSADVGAFPRGPQTTSVQTAADWNEIVRDNGIKIPPFGEGEVDAFIAVKRKGAWKIEMQNPQPGS